MVHRALSRRECRPPSGHFSAAARSRAPGAAWALEPRPRPWGPGERARFTSPPRPPLPLCVPSLCQSSDSLGRPYCWPRLSLCGPGDMNGWARHTFQPSREKKVRICIGSGRDSSGAPRAYAAGQRHAQLPLPQSLLPSLKKKKKNRPTQINNIVPSLPASSVPSPSSRAQRAPVLQKAATGGGGAGPVRGAEREAGAPAAALCSPAPWRPTPARTGTW